VVNTPLLSELTTYPPPLPPRQGRTEKSSSKRETARRGLSTSSHLRIYLANPPFACVWITPEMATCNSMRIGSEFNDMSRRVKRFLSTDSSENATERANSRRHISTMPANCEPEHAFDILSVLHKKSQKRLAGQQTEYGFNVGHRRPSHLIAPGVD